MLDTLLKAAAQGRVEFVDLSGGQDKVRTEEEPEEPQEPASPTPEQRKQKALKSIEDLRAKVESGEYTGFVYVAERVTDEGRGTSVMIEFPVAREGVLPPERLVTLAMRLLGIAIHTL